MSTPILPAATPTASPCLPPETQPADIQSAVGAVSQQAMSQLADHKCNMDCKNCTKSVCTLKTSVSSTPEEKPRKELAETFRTIARFFDPQTGFLPPQKSSPRSSTVSTTPSEDFQKPIEHSFPKLLSLKDSGSTSPRSQSNSPRSEESSPRSSSSSSPRSGESSPGTSSSSPRSEPRVRTPAGRSPPLALDPILSDEKKSDTVIEQEDSHPSDKPCVEPQ